MRNSLLALVRKELLLVFHPMTLVVLGLSVLVLVPNWPYAVILIYACLCQYFNAQSAREQRDLDFSETLPVSRRSMVASRIAATTLVELLCVFLMLAFSLVRPVVGTPDSFVGMPPNLAFLGFSLLVFSVFDIVFFSTYYRNPAKIGIPFILASLPALAVMLAFESAPYLFDTFASLFAQPGFDNLAAQLTILIACVIIYCLGRVFTVKQKKKALEKVDI